uniref:PAS domain-containing protein n=1 Tax=Eptatretus burgeri TaxID=7764 RepID=A0A8C4QTM8_EPTBU
GNGFSENASDLEMQKLGIEVNYQTEHWREQEHHYIKELAELVSANIGEVNSFNVLPDKCAVLRETVSQIRRVGLRERGVSPRMSSCLAQYASVFCVPQALDAFFFVVAQDGKIVFASENVGRFLNCSREELMHRSVYSILHPSDHAEFLHNFMPQGYGEYSGFVMDPSDHLWRLEASPPDRILMVHVEINASYLVGLQHCFNLISSPPRPPPQSFVNVTLLSSSGKVIGIEAMKLRSVVKVGWEQLVRECLKAFYNTSLVQQHHLQGLALSPPYQFSLPDGSMFTAQTRSKLHCNTSLYQDPFIQSLHVLHRYMFPQINVLHMETGRGHEVTKL